jgi:nucleotide-binding universal stress UspA family protein
LIGRRGREYNTLVVRREPKTHTLDYDSLRIKNVLVPVDGSKAGYDALALACYLSKRNKGTVYAVYVIEVARNLPLDAEMSKEASSGESVLTESERVAADMDYKVSGELLQARDKGHAIVDEATDRDVDAIVMGVGYERTRGEFTDAEAAEYVVRNAGCKVMLFRGAVGDVHV